MYVGIDEVINWATRNRSTLEDEAAAILGPLEYRNAEDLVQKGLEKIVKAFRRNPERIKRPLPDPAGKRKHQRTETNKVIRAYLTTTMRNQHLDDLDKRKITEIGEDGQERTRWVVDHLTDKLPEQLHEEPYEDPWLPYVEVDPRPTTRRLPPIPVWFRGRFDLRCPKCRKFLALIEADPDTDLPPETARHDPGRMDLHDVRAIVRRAVSRDLTPRQAETVYYVFWDDLEQVDVAKLWGRKPATVNVTMGDARKRLLTNADVQRAWQASRRPSQRAGGEPASVAKVPAPRTPAPAHREYLPDAADVIAGRLMPPRLTLTPQPGQPYDEQFPVTTRQGPKLPVVPIGRRKLDTPISRARRRRLEQEQQESRAAA